MKTKLQRFKAWLCMLVVMVLCAGNAWGTDLTYSFTIATSDFNTTSYAENNGSHTSTAVCTTDATKTKSVVWTSNQIMQSSSTMQWQKSNAYIYNTTDLGSIVSVTETSTAGAFTKYYGTSEHPTSGTTVGNGYFTIQVGNATGKTSQIVVTFTLNESSGTTPTALSAPTNLTSSNINSTSATLSWDAVTNASSYTLKLGDTEITNATSPYSATGLTAGTEYTWSVKAIGDGTNYSSSAYASDAKFTTTTPKHKVYFSVNGTLLDENGTEVAERAAISFPANPANIGDKVFVGWYGSDYSNTTTAPIYVTSATMGEQDVTYYAVFAKQSAGKDTWNQVTTLANIVEGQYVIKNGSYVLSNEIASSSAPDALTAPTVENNTITGDVADNMIWVFTSTGTANQFYVKNPDGKYLYETSNNNGLRVNTTSDKWTFETNTTGYFAMKGANNSRYCAQYSAGTDWRSYTTATATNYTNSGKLELYKKTASTVYSDFATSVVVKTLIGIEATGTPAEFWKGDTFNHDGMTVTATWDDESETDVTAEATFSTPDMATAGEQTITVTYQGETCKYNIDVKTIENTQTTAYTITEAIAKYNAGKDLTSKVYVKGTVSAITTPWNDTNNNITYAISVDGKTTSTQFLLYRCETNGGEVGDDVIAYGKLAQYNLTTNELAAGNTIVSIIKHTDFSIANIAVKKGEDITPVISTNIVGEYAIEYVSSDENVVIADDDELCTGDKTGTATITATIVADGYKTAETTFTVTVTSNATLSSIAISGDLTKSTYTVGDDFDFSGLTATGTMSDETTADLTNTVTWSVEPAALTVGTTSVTVKATSGEISGTKDYDITVKGKEPVFAFEKNNYSTPWGSDLTVKASSEESEGTVKYSISTAMTTPTATIDETTGVFKSTKPGSYIVKATIEANGNYAAKSIETTVTVVKQDANIEFENATYTVDVESSITVALKEYTTTGTLTFESSDNNVATVDENRVVTALGVGNVTITAKTKENDLYNAGTATCQITVNDPEGIAAGWIKVTAVDQLADGDEVIIVATDDSKAFGNISNSKAQGVDVTLTSDKSTVTEIGDAIVFTLKASGNNFGLYVEGKGYLQTTLSTKNAYQTNLSWSEVMSTYSYWKPVVFEKEISNTFTDDYHVNGTIYFRLQKNGTTDVDRGIIYQKYVPSENSTKAESYVFANYAPGTNYGTDAKQSTGTTPGTNYYLPVAIYKKSTTTTGEISVSSVGWATYYTRREFTMPENLEGYIVTSNDESKVTLTKKFEGGNTVPAATPLLIKSTETLTDTKSYEYTITTTGASAITEDNLLHGNLTKGTVAAVNGANAYYKLFNGSNGLGWYLGAADGGRFTLGANRAYLALTDAQANSVKSFALDFGGDDTLTGIESINENTDAAIYDLSGRRVVAPVRGQLYISNGKKFIQK